MNLKNTALHIMIFVATLFLSILALLALSNTHRPDLIQEATAGDPIPPGCRVIDVLEVYFNTNPGTACNEGEYVEIVNDRTLKIGFDRGMDWRGTYNNYELCNWEYHIDLDGDSDDHFVRAKYQGSAVARISPPYYDWDTPLEKSWNSLNLTTNIGDTGSGCTRIGGYCVRSFSFDYWDGGDEWPTDSRRSAQNPRGSQDGRIGFLIQVSDECVNTPTPTPIPTNTPLPTPTTCVPTPPDAPSGLNPGTQNASNPEVVEGENATMTWSPPFSWGNSCAGSNSYVLSYRSYDPNSGGCSYTDSNWTRVPKGLTNRSHMITLNPGESYCWYVNANNGSLGSNSEIRYFSSRNKPFFITARGDVYINGNFDQELREGLELTTSISNNVQINRNSKLQKITSNLINDDPRISSNLFITNTNRATFINSQNSFTSKIRAILNLQPQFIDNTFQQYTLPHDGVTQDYSNSFYEYYLNKLREDTSIVFEEETISLSETRNPTHQALRSIFGSNLSNERKVIHVNPQSGDTIYLNEPSAANPGFICSRQSIYLINGNLKITTNIFNSSGNPYEPNCLFIIKGDLIIEPLTGSPLTSENYIIIEGLFMANRYVIESSTSDGAVAVHGSIITHKSNSQTPNNNLHDVNASDFERPQDIYIYDPRHLIYWADILDGSSSNSPIREQRFLQLIENE